MSIVEFHWATRTVLRATDNDGEWWRLKGGCEKCGRCCEGCKHLENNKCKIHSFNWKPWRCVIYPKNPEEKLYPNCGFKWEEING